MEYEEFSYENLKNQVTGNWESLEDSKVVGIPFDKYVIKIRLSATNRFIGVEEVIVNKDFLKHNQRLIALSAHGYLDVEQYYQEEEEEVEEE